MTRSAAKERKLYLDVNDATDELGITRRQLRHWEDNGLLEPELGKNRYTETDLEQLRLIKRLVVDEGSPVDIVRRLFEKQLWEGKFFDEDAHARVRTGDLTNYVLDIDSGSLLPRGEMFKRLWYEVLATAEERDLEALLAQAALVYFRLLSLDSRTPAGYVGHVEEILGRMQELSRVARLEPVYADDDKGPGPVTGIRLHPLLPGETEQSTDLAALVARNESVVIDLEKARNDLIQRGRYEGHERLGDFSDYIDLRR
jgi:DNA-binding transcriptional MerR regulator